ncbi:MAG TPA: hypothetical protein DHV31_00730 [Clostridiales bacterium]|nr:hypothetical protein [Clostridiales bacterium]
MRIRLGERLNTVLSLIEGGRVCDVGTDHGKLPVAALLSGRVSEAIAIDISAKSLAKARLLAEQEGVPLRCLQGDGLTPLSEKQTDTVVIAGMGGAETVKILSEAPCTFSKYIFVPHKNAPLVRKYLKDNNARITHDIAVKEDKHFYFVIEADPSLSWQEKSLYFGEEGAAFSEYRAWRLQKIEHLLSLKEDPSLREEKEELSHAHPATDRAES